MKNTILCFLLALSTGIIAWAQPAQQGKTDDLGKILLTPYVDSEGMEPATQSNLENKLDQVILKSGFGSGFISRFILAAHVSVLSKDITSSAPPMQAYTLAINLYIGDGYEGIKFAGETITLKGVGETETKAYLAALKNLNTDDAKVRAFVEKGKAKIIEYYNANCDAIIKESQVLAGQNKHDEAIFKLLAIPQACAACYEKSSSTLAQIYKKKIDRDCQLKLNEAGNLWAANQNVETANQIGEILSTVDPASACFGEVKALSGKVAARVKEIDTREWKYTLKDQAQESERIEAIRAIGVAYGNGQPKSVTYNVRGWW